MKAKLISVENEIVTYPSFEEMFKHIPVQYNFTEELDYDEVPTVAMLDEVLEIIKIKSESIANQINSYITEIFSHENTMLIDAKQPPYFHHFSFDEVPAYQSLSTVVNNECENRLIYISSFRFYKVRYSPEFSVGTTAQAARLHKESNTYVQAIFMKAQRAIAIDDFLITE